MMSAKAQKNSDSPVSGNQNVYLTIRFLKYFRPLGISSLYIAFWVCYICMCIYMKDGNLPDVSLMVGSCTVFDEGLCLVTEHYSLIINVIIKFIYHKTLVFYIAASFQKCFFFLLPHVSYVFVLILK
jgi:hypothetical protein